MIKWGRTVSLSGSGIVGFYHASNWQTVYNDKGSFYLDINGILNGTNAGTLQDYGTFDVYINGSRVANDVNDYYQEYDQPKLIVETSLDYANTSYWNHYKFSYFKDKVFYVMGMEIDLKKDSVKYKLKEI
jgi:hypothetical protein